MSGGGFNRLLSIDITTGAIVEADYPALAHDANYGQCFFKGGLRSKGWWSANNKTAYFVDYQRGDKTRSVVAFNTDTGATKVLLTETTNTVFKIQTVGQFKPLPATDELLWLSDIDGWVHLYLYDLATGKLKRQLTEGEWVVRDMLYVDAIKREAVIAVCARTAQRDPYYRELIKVHLDTGALTVIASSNHDYNNTSVSPTGHYLVTTRSRIDDTPVSVVFDCHNNEEIMPLETADISALPEGYQWPEPVKMMAADGKTAIYGAIYRPSHFDSAKRYPVLEHTFYCNTDDISTPKGAFSNSVFDGAMAQQIQSLAELGMIVVTIDGRGGIHRSKAFADHSYGWAPSVSDIDDRVAGLKQLAERYPAMDLTRVGITGWRGATQALYALLEYPDFYKVAVLPEMHDTRLIQYPAVSSMEPPQADSSQDLRHYKHHLHKLKGKLLIRHGMIDIFNTVGGSFRLIHELEKANKDFEMLIMPKQEVFPSDYTLRRTWDYLVKNLIGDEPPKEFSMDSGDE